MSELIPESIPTSQDRSKRPLKRRALTPVTQQANQVEALFAKPDREIAIPSGALTKKNSLQPPPEIVANVQGSSAGAGSGEFHVYKASRRREYERVKMMEEEVAKEQADEEFEKKREEMRQKDEEKTGKNRKRRERNKKKKDANGDRKDGVKDGAVNVNKDAKKMMPGPRPNDQVDGDVMPATTAEDVGVIIHDDD